MPKILLKTLLFVALASGAHAQCLTYTIGAKGDTLNCVDTLHHRQGPWVIHMDELRGEPGYEEEGYFRDDVKDGTWRRYDLQGDLTAIEQYKWGNKDGLQEYLLPSGERLREESWMAVDPQNPYDTVTVYDDPRNPFRTSRKVVKLDANSYKHGTWNYFDPSTGTIAKTEHYVLGKLQDGGLTTNVAQNARDSTALPKEVQDYNKKNSGKKKIKVRTGETSGGD